MPQKHRLPIRQTRSSTRAEAAVPYVPLAPDETPFARIEWSPTEQTRIAELLAKEPNEPTPKLLRALKAPRR